MRMRIFVLSKLVAAWVATVSAAISWNSQRELSFLGAVISVATGREPDLSVSEHPECAMIRLFLMAKT